MLGNKIYTVTEATAYLKGLFRQDELLQDLWVSGEVSNYYHHSSGHCYFTLKDKESSMRAVLFKTYASKIPFQLENGLEVLARGNIDIYHVRGEYQLYIKEMELAGIGALHLAFEQLKKKLEEEGLFASEYKKVIPLLPEKIGIVTSPTGAAVKDILSVLERRFKGISVLISPARVQGEGAAEEIVDALHSIQQEGVDVVILARGGGSLEELWPFNEEKLARAIFTSTVPIISAVGHERDFTIADFVADLRAPTPSAAAEMVVKSRSELEEQVLNMKNRMMQSLQGKLMQARLDLKRLARRRIFLEPGDAVNVIRQRVDDCERRLEKQMSHIMSMEKERLFSRASRLEGLNPIKVMARGYSICRDQETGQVIKAADELERGKLVELLFTRGTASARIEDIEE